MLMVEAQQSLGSLLSQMDQAGGLASLALGFGLGLVTAILIFYQALLKA